MIILDEKHSIDVDSGVVLRIKTGVNKKGEDTYQFKYPIDLMHALKIYRTLLIEDEIKSEDRNIVEFTEVLKKIDDIFRNLRDEYIKGKGDKNEK